MSFETRPINKRASAENFPERQRKKDKKKNSKNTENNTIKSLPGRGVATEKRPKNSTIKPLSTISVYYV